MDRTSSHGSNSSAVGKQLEKLPPFKLCFSKDRLIGKSNIRVSKINGIVYTIFKTYRFFIAWNKENLFTKKLIFIIIKTMISIRQCVTITGESITPKFYSKEYENRANNFNAIGTFEKTTEEQENGGNCSRRPPVLLSSNA